MEEILGFIVDLRDRGIDVQELGEQLKVTGNVSSLTTQDKEEIKRLKPLLLDFLKGNKNVREQSFNRIDAIKSEDHYPVSSAQQRLWLLSQFEEGNVAYNMPGVYVFEGNLNYSALENSFNSLLERHEILRTVFREDELTGLRQFILPAENTGASIIFRDLRDTKDQRKMVSNLVQEERGKPFHLASGPLIRAGVYQLEINKWIFTYTMHHIISDGWSMDILIREMLLFYNTYIQGTASPLTPLRIQYKDYAAWQQKLLKDNDYLHLRSYWLKQFEGELPVLELVGDYARPAVKTYNGGIVYKTLNKDLIQKFNVLMKQQHATPFMGVLALVNTLLYKYTGQGDQIIGSPVAGREHVDLEDQIGFYVNTLALRSRFNGTDSFKAVLNQVRKLTIEAYEYQGYPFDELIEALHLQHDMSRSALFDVMVTMNNDKSNEHKEQKLGDLVVSIYQGAENMTSKFDLIFGFTESTEDMRFSISYNSDIFTAETISRFATHLDLLMAAVLDSPDRPIEQLDYLAAEEKQHLLFDFNPAAIDYPKDKTINKLFEEQAAQTPDHIAVVFEDIKITYRELNEKANQLADYLRKEYTISPDELIGIQLERGVWVIISILGVLKSGGAYVPLDPEYPQERIDYLVKDSQCRLVIDNVELEKFTAFGSALETQNSDYPGSASQLAYVIYTSGSTGNPKGVAVEHKSVVRLVKSANYVSITADDHILSLSNFSFDGSVFDIFGALLNGASLVIPIKDIFLDFQLLARMIQEQEISLFFITTALFNSLADIDFVTFSKLQYILFGGERVSTGHVKKFRAAHPEVELIHVYGPTENTTFSSYYPVVDGDEERFTIPIGSGISNSQCYILNGPVNFGQLSPIGIVGEICVGGDGLARGYLNRPELTREKFISNPFVEGERLYKTGDLGRWLSNGSIEFIGRKDDQVKIRGFRIELGEVETALENYQGIHAAVVLAVADQDGERSLVAYVTGDVVLNATDVRSYLVQFLPAYMIPAYFMQLDEFPLTVNGKVDKKHLPSIAEMGMFSGVEYVEARNETESKLVLIWSDILGITKEKISVKDNFFEIGGHSLKATRMVSRINKEFEVKITLKELFALPVLEMLAQLIQETAKTSFIAIPPAEHQPSYVMSSSQRRLWVLSQLEEGSSAYNMPGVYIFEGELNQRALELSFNSLLERHEILRTVFREDEFGEIRQFILPIERVGFFYEDLRDRANQEENIWNRVQEASSTSFDLAVGPLVRADLYRVEENKWVFIYVMHHIISDGWSMGILIKELLLLYNANKKGEINSLLPLNIQYKDYAEWQQKQLSDESFLVHKNYWLKQFKGELPVLELPADHSRPAVKTYNGNTVNQWLDRELTAGLQKISQEHGATLFMGLLALVNTLLYRYTGQEDIIIGSPIAGREHADLEEQIGFYVNTLALRSRFKGTDNFKDILGHVKQITLDAYEHQIYPFDDLVELLELQYDMSRNTLFDVMVELQTNEIKGTKEPQLENLAISAYKGKGGQSSKFELTFGFVEANDELQIIIEYNTDLFEEVTIRRLIHHLEHLLRAVIQRPFTPIEQLDYLSKAEKKALLVDFNNTLTDYPANKTIISFFEEQVEKTPDQIALIFNQTELTYSALNARSNQLANYLQRKYQVQADDLIAVMLERSEMMVIAILAIFKSGGAYVPIDPEYPKERVDFILADCSSKVLLNAQELELFAEEVDQYDTHNLIPDYGPDNLAYLIYTSGSTGKPKGTMIEHRGMLNHLLAMVDQLELNSGSRIAQNASFTFDISVWQLLNAIIVGGCTVIYDQATILDPPLFLESVISNNINILQVVPSYLKTMLDIMDQDKHHDLNGLKYLLVTGEAVNQQLLKRWFNIFPAVKVVNAYGPAEAADDITLYIMDKAPETVNIPVGKPIQNMKIYILDRLQNLCPIGISGEIYVSGMGVGRAYLNDQEKTAYSFMIDPFQTDADVRMYRTGDHGKWNADGNVEFIGRKDEQVKIRGYRIELGDIENALLQHPLIEEAAVLAKKEKDDGKSLFAYLVSNAKLNIEELRIYLSKLLPAYMLPAYFVELDEMPLNANGKVDKKLLLQIESTNMNNGILFLTPRNQLELKLTEIWGNVLGIPGNKISVKDNFFDIGGHSLKATRLVSQIHKEFGVKIALKDLFNTSILETQAFLIKQSGQTSQEVIPVVPLHTDYVLSSSQRRLWVLSQFEDGNIAYNMPGIHVFEGKLDQLAFEFSFKSLLERHEILRTQFREDQRGEIRQTVLSLEEAAFAVTYLDLRRENNQQEKISTLIQNEITRPFDLAMAPLLRAGLWQTADNKWIFVYAMHHIISDGWSMNILIKELLYFYNTYRAAQIPDLPPLRIQYKDYANWQQQQLTGKSLIAHRDYWLEQFAGEIPVLDLPADSIRPTVKTYNGGFVNQAINASTSKGLKLLIQEEGATLFMGLLSVVNVLLHRYSGQEDLIVGSPIAGRENIDLENQIGFYVNTLALRSRFKATDNFRDLLAHVKQVTLDAYEHQVFPFDELVDALKLQRDVSRSPLFDVMLVLQNNGGGEEVEPQLGELSVSAYEGGENQTSRFDLTFDFIEIGEEIQFSISYNNDIFSQGNARGFAVHLKKLLEAIVAAPDQAIGKLNYLSEEEKTILLDVFNKTTVAYPNNKTITALFEAQVNNTPGHTALVFGDVSVSYRELNARANQFARYLKFKYNLATGDLIGIKLERSSSLVVAILGVLKTGGAYVPIDPDYPQERIAYILADSNCKVLVDEEEIATFENCAHNYTIDNLLSVHNSENLVYVIYTSGSTGQPKGVMVEHHSLVNLCYWHNRDFGVSASDRASIYAGVAFDASAWELFPYLLTGACLYVVPDAIRLDISGLQSFYDTHGITIAFLPTQIGEQFLGMENHSLRYLLLGGDKLHSFTEQRYAVVNNYGPTENTVVTTSWQVNEHSLHIPIGRPVSNTHIYILSELDELVAIGVTGEICIGGAGLAKGYLNKPELTAEKFVADPFRAGERMYKTGDLGRWRADGSIVFAGRKDDQVKIRGYRIELGEIEAALQTYEEIDSAVVFAKADASGDKNLIAYLVSKQNLDITALHSYLSTKIPSYMIPIKFIQLENLPLTANGKVDHHRLPAPDDLWEQVTNEVYIEPDTATEKKLVEIWTEVLGQISIGVEHNFFSLGGNSVKIIRMQKLVNQSFETNFSIANFFEYLTIRLIANEIDKLKADLSEHAGNTEKEIQFINF